MDKKLLTTLLVTALILSIAAPAAAAPPTDKGNAPDHAGEQGPPNHAANPVQPGNGPNGEPGIPDHAIDKRQQLQPAPQSDIKDLDVEVIETTNGNRYVTYGADHEVHAKIGVNMENGTFIAKEKSKAQALKELRQEINDPNTSEEERQKLRQVLRSNIPGHGPGGISLTTTFTRETQGVYVKLLTEDPVGYDIAKTKFWYEAEYSSPDYWWESGWEDVTSEYSYVSDGAVSPTDAGTHWYHWKTDSGTDDGYSGAAYGYSDTWYYNWDFVLFGDNEASGDIHWVADLGDGWVYGVDSTDGDISLLQHHVWAGVYSGEDWTFNGYHKWEGEGEYVDDWTFMGELDAWGYGTNSDHRTESPLPG